MLRPEDRHSVYVVIRALRLKGVAVSPEYGKRPNVRPGSLT